MDFVEFSPCVSPKSCHKVLCVSSKSCHKALCVSSKSCHKALCVSSKSCHKALCVSSKSRHKALPGCGVTTDDVCGKDRTGLTVGMKLVDKYKLNE